jgi:tetratricopeptide (TPR) repeat protein
MARAAVRAKQAQQAQAQAAATKPSRKSRKHASGGNPNQDLFFSRLRRKQKWVFFMLAVVFALSFVLLGVGSGNGGGLEQMINGLGIFGNGSDPVASAQAEIKAGNDAGYTDLATAYITQGNTPLAIAALEKYLEIKKKDSAEWSQLGSLKTTQADKYATQYQQIQQATQLEAPDTLFQPTGALAGKLGGSNPVDQYYTQQNDALLSPLYRNATTGYTDALAAFKQAAKFAKPGDRANAEFAVYRASQLAGQPKVGLTALQRFVVLDPTSPGMKQIEAACVSLGGKCVPKQPKKK